MIKEFEGKSEKEAIDNAIAELDLKEGEFDVEIIETSKPLSFFKKGNIKIRVYANGDESAIPRRTSEADSTGEKKVVEFIETVIQKMGFTGEITTSYRDKTKLIINIDSPDSGYIIGKKGKNLDALQTLLNIYALRVGLESRIILDAESYRNRREQQIVDMARKAAKQVLQSRRSRLLEPMNPFERRLIHTTLNDSKNILTTSEGEGSIKQVRVFYKEEN